MGREYPLVIKSPLFFPSLFSLVNRLSIFSLTPIIFRRFFFSFSSFSTRAVSDAVAAFLMPLPESLDAEAEPLFPLCDADGLLVPFAVSALSTACFLRFFEPGAFLRE